jgi:hypothetical protein
MLRLASEALHEVTQSCDRSPPLFLALPEPQPWGDSVGGALAQARDMSQDTAIALSPISEKGWLKHSKNSSNGYRRRRPESSVSIPVSMARVSGRRNGESPTCVIPNISKPSSASNTPLNSLEIQEQRSVR